MRHAAFQSAGRRESGERGQPAGLYRLDPEGAFGIGLRLGRSRIESVVADLAGNIRRGRSHDLRLPTPEHALEIVCDDIQRVLRILKPAERGRLAGIGLGRSSCARAPPGLSVALSSLSRPHRDYTQETS